MTDYNKFNQTLSQIAPVESLSQRDAADAFHNLSGFMSVLIKINEREQIVSTKSNGRIYENK